MKLINYKALADKLGVPIGTAYSLVSRGQIPHIRISGRMVRFDEEEIDRWLEARAVSAVRLSGEVQTESVSEIELN